MGYWHYPFAQNSVASLLKCGKVHSPSIFETSDYLISCFLTCFFILPYWLESKLTGFFAFLWLQSQLIKTLSERFCLKWSFTALCTFALRFLFRCWQPAIPLSLAFVLTFTRLHHPSWWAMCPVYSRGCFSNLTGERQRPFVLPLLDLYHTEQCWYCKCSRTSIAWPDWSPATEFGESAATAYTFSIFLSSC
jgi:hypothetical protein